MSFISISCWIWVGLIIGVSFVATPAKFLAPDLSLIDALSVGRVTFKVFSWIELTLLINLLALMFWEKLLPPKGIVLIAAIVLCLAINYVGLKPFLDHRVQLMMEGQTVPHSPVHRIYIIVEVIKLGLIAALGYFSANTFNNVLINPSG